MIEQERSAATPPGAGAWRTVLAKGTNSEAGTLGVRDTGVPADGVEDQMTLLKWALIFFVVSVIAGVLGFTGLSAASADIARFLFYVFVVIFLVLLILGLTIFRV